MCFISRLSVDFGKVKKYLEQEILAGSRNVVFRGTAILPVDRLLSFIDRMSMVLPSRLTI
jgi:hypothetical protein